MTFLGIWQGGRLGFVTMPKIDRFQIYVRIRLAPDTSFEETDKFVLHVADAAARLRDETRDGGNGQSLIRGIMTGTGNNYRGNGEDNEGSVNIDIVPPSERSEPGPTNVELEQRLRALIGPIPEGASLRFYSHQWRRGGGDMEGVEVELRGPDSDRKLEIAREIESYLEEFPGIFNTDLDHEGRRNELEITLKPEARDLGIDESELARQIRQSFFGAEAQRIQRDREEIRVMVRLPEERRDNLHTLQSLEIKTPEGATIPFGHVAIARTLKVPSSVFRRDGERVLQISGSTRSRSVDIGAIAETARPEIDRMVSRDPNLSWVYRGFIEEQERTDRQTLFSWLIIVGSLYALLAIPFRSLLQPIFVLLAIPFGLIGAILGHMIMGVTPSSLSMFGMMALAGVVVNDSLVMVDFTNRRVRDGQSLRDAVLNSGASRFRPIMLTSLTTFAGLMPLILDRSIQAQFLIPMAISLAFGILFATAITLILIPCSYLVNEDVKSLFRRSWRWYAGPFRPAEEEQEEGQEESSLPQPPPIPK